MITKNAKNVKENMSSHPPRRGKTWYQFLVQGSKSLVWNNEWQLGKLAPQNHAASGGPVTGSGKKKWRRQGGSDSSDALWEYEFSKYTSQRILLTKQLNNLTKNVVWKGATSVESVACVCGLFEISKFNAANSKVFSAVLTNRDITKSGKLNK